MKVNQRRFQHQITRCFVKGYPSKIGLLALLVAFPITLSLTPQVSGAADDANDTDPVEKPVAGSDVDALVKQLGDDSYLVRESATASIWKIGRGALPSLRRAMAGNDPEAGDRASELFLYITSGVLSDSPEEVKALVLKFSRSHGEGKIVILGKLLDLGQWRQVLHLARLEEDPAVKKQMADIVKKTAGRATRDAISKGDFDLAEEILELTSDDPQSMLLRAWFYCRRGNLDQQLAKAAKMPGKKGSMWRMSLHRASGNIRAAILEADKAGEEKLADAMRVLEGNARPWLQRNGKQANLDVIYSMGCRIQLDRLAGKEKQAALIARELAGLARNEDSSARVSNCLAANGYRQEAVDLLRRHDIKGAFNYFDSIESPQSCLEVLGVPKDAKLPYTSWVKKFTDNAIEEEDEDLYHQLILLANFLVTHGHREHALSVLTPLMKALEDDGADEWFDLITIMSIYGLGEEAVHFIVQRGNEDGEADLAVKKFLNRMPSKSLSNIWGHLMKRNNMDLTKALREVALLSGMIADPDGETDKLHKTLVDEVANAAAEVKEARMTALFQFSVKRNDLAAASRMADQLAAADGRWTASKVYLDTALLRWKDIEPSIAAEAKKKPGNYFNLMKWYIALRKLNRDDEAKKVYQRVLMLSMGNAEILNRLGKALYDAGFDAKAVDLWLHGAALADPSNSGYDQAIFYLAQYGHELYRRGDWQLAAAITETSTQLMMRGRSGSSVNLILRARFYAEFCKGMDLLKKGKKSTALKTLDAARKLIPGDGSLADEFFPVLRKEDIGKQYDLWFDDSYRHVAAACKLYPQAHNSHNTAAWLAARATRKLDAALVHAKAALKIRPTQGAYIDTMAEVWFAKGDRAKAVEWSKKAVAGSISHAHGTPRTEGQVINNFQQLSKQLERFKKEPIPK